jgi:hypothetical protein
MNVCSYAGFYKNYYLRSSYEYIYCRVLEAQDKKFEIEKYTYTLSDGTTYKPDFFILNDNNEIISIDEIKSENKTRIEEAKRKIELLKRQLNIPINLLFSKDLKILCKENQLDFYKLKAEWINSEMTSQNHILSREMNPMFNHKHKEISKKINGQKTSLRFKDENFRLKHSEAVKKAMQKVDKSKLIGNKRKDREQRICLYCGKVFNVIYTSKQKYCCKTCSALAGFDIATKKNIEQNHLLLNTIKQDTINFLSVHKDNLIKINNGKYHGKKEELIKLLKPIIDRYYLADMRTIYYSFYKKHNIKVNQFINDILNII